VSALASAVPPRAAFVEVPTAAFAFARALNGQAGLDAASLQTVIAALRQDIEDASRDLAAAIGRRLGEPRQGRDRRRERRRRRLGSEGRAMGESLTTTTDKER
jgi:hypothetical protein